MMAVCTLSCAARRVDCYPALSGHQAQEYQQVASLSRFALRACGMLAVRLLG